MAAAWSLSRGSNSRDSVSRLVSTLSLDGYRVAVELVVRFNRSLNKDTAESIGNEVARITDEILGAQISQGSLPLTTDERSEQVLDRASGGAN
jgi:hypothetical protein